MSFKHKTDKQLLSLSLYGAFEQLKSEGKSREAAVDRMAAITTILVPQLEQVADMVYPVSK